ncbi:MAG: hypothetical protein ACRD2E_11120 [Terriglobales bacterium]
MKQVADAAGVTKNTLAKHEGKVIEVDGSPLRCPVPLRERFGNKSRKYSEADKTATVEYFRRRHELVEPPPRRPATEAGRPAEKRA